ncbi:glycosyltransferase family 39 protein [Streptomyces sp. CC224B]|uniref:glycosyltransferase family 39 protein n=1 Tax=Streptomyces sp. CC224B TaxID=3044571 RepID=UPI0024A9C6F1|nr:glycosyltransferase family 39 protein [Streptomyces sp. CC224B]
MPKNALGPAGPAVLALVLGLWGITREDSMWRDEAATWMAADRTLTGLRRLLDHADVVHGCYYLLMHGLFELFGPGLGTLRLPSVLATACAAAATAATGRRLAGPWAGLLAGTAFVLLPSTQRYAQEGRSYALVVAAVAVATWLLVTLAEGRPGARVATWRWAAYAGTMLVAALLNWFSLLALLAHAGTVLRARRHGAGHLTRHWPVAAAVVVTGALPLVLASRAQARQVAWIPALTWTTALTPLGLLGAGLLCGLLVRRWPGTPSRAAKPAAPVVSVVSAALPLLAVPVLALLAASLVKPLYLDRYILYANVGLGLLLGAALGVLVRSWRPFTALVLVASAALLPLQLGLRTPQSRVDDVLASADAVARLSRPGDGVLFIPSLRRDTAEVSPRLFAELDDVALVRSPADSGTLRGVEAAPARIRKAMLAERRILVVGDPEDHPGGSRDATKRRVLAAFFVRCADAETRGRRVQVYERGTNCSGAPAGRP